MSVARRRFLRLMAAAPVAAPVVAREAAQKAGIGAVGLGVDQFGPAVPGDGQSNASSEREWLLGWCKRVFTSEWEEEKRREGRNWPPSRLDPDLAASRSLSLSAAMRIQQDRNIERRIASEREEASRRYFGLFKTEFRP
jgi:hypothetical protein